MRFTLDALPYAENALEPHISQKTLQVHYGKHHQGYLNKLEKALEDTGDAEKSLTDIIKNAPSPSIYNLAAQVWNHTFYWQSLSPSGGGQPPPDVLEVLDKHFGGFENFKNQFADAAKSQFGSGWAWLVKDSNDNYLVMQTANAENPISDGFTPILTLDVWEHAYYIDYQSDRSGYVDTFFKHLINWQHVSDGIQ